MPNPPRPGTLSETKENRNARGLDILDGPAPRFSEMRTMTRFVAAAEVCERLARTPGRLDRARLLADFLAALAAEEVAPAVRLLLGLSGRGETAVSGRTLWRV